MRLLIIINIFLLFGLSINAQMVGTPYFVSSNEIAIGYLNFPGTTNVLSWTSNNQLLSTNQTSANAMTIGALLGYEIDYAGQISTSAGVTVANSSTSLGSFNGGGIVNIRPYQTSTTTNWTVQNGAQLDLGIKNNAALATAGIGGTITNNGTVNYFSVSNSSANASKFNNTSTGIINIESNNTGTPGRWDWGSPATNNGVINVKDVFFNQGTATSMLGTGTINLLSGAHASNVFSGGANPYPNITLNLDGAFGNSFSGTTTGVGIGGSASYNTNTINCNTTGSIGNGYWGGFFTGSGTITLGNFSAQTRFQSVFTGFTGTLRTFTGATTAEFVWVETNGSTWLNTTVDISGGGIFYPSVATNIKKLIATNTASQLNCLALLTISGSETSTFSGSLAGAGGITVSGGGTLNVTSANPSTSNVITVSANSYIGAGTTTTGSVNSLNLGAVGGIMVNPITTSSASRLTCTTLTSTAFKVGISGAMNAGTYTILTATAGNKPVPTIGLNNSGRSATFSWSGNNLIMTLI